MAVSRRSVSLGLCGFAAGAILIGAMGASNHAWAEGAGPHAEVMVLHATQSPDAWIDPQIGESKRLREPPFSSYNNYKLLEKKTLPLKKGEASNLPLPTSRTLQVLLLDKVEQRFKVSASISQPDGKAYLKLLEVTAAPNETFFVAGQTYNKGSLVLAIKIVP